MEKDTGDGGMTIKRKLQIVLDVAMIVLLPFLMSYQLIGEATHEWFGIGMFLLLVFHHLLNLQLPLRRIGTNFDQRDYIFYCFF